MMELHDLIETGIAIRHLSDFDIPLEPIQREFEKTLLRRFEVDPPKPNIFRFENFYWEWPWKPIAKWIKNALWRELARDYLQAEPVFGGFRIWRVGPHEGEWQGSQLWHRDEQTGHDEPWPTFRVFLHVNDVGVDDGPFQYIRSSHAYGQRAHVIRPGARITDVELLDAMPDLHKHRLLTTGPAGTMIFADTSGIHCGGRSRAGRRDVLVVTYYAT